MGDILTVEAKPYGLSFLQRDFIRAEGKSFGRYFDDGYVIRLHGSDRRCGEKCGEHERQGGRARNSEAVCSGHKSYVLK
jgi:hypothetical protein